MTIGLLAGAAVQGLVVAWTARPIIYDEHYHLAAIQELSRWWSPIIRQSPQAPLVGDVERYASFLYHWLMSYPYRWMTATGATDDLVVAGLRSVSTAIAVLGFWYVWRLARALCPTPAQANLVLALVTLAPLVTFVSGAVNYDNLFHTLTWMFLYYAVRVVGVHTVHLGPWLAAAATFCAAAVTKPQFLALGGIVAGWLGWHLWQIRRDVPRAWRSYRAVRPPLLVRRAALALVTIVSAGLAAERFLGNLLRFGTPLPSCVVVQDLETCLRHGPTARNVRLDATHVDPPMSVGGAVEYLRDHWYPLMQRHITLIGIAGENGVSHTSLGSAVTGHAVVYAIPPLLLLAAAWVLLHRNRTGLVLLAATGAYLLGLFAKNYTGYVDLGEPIAVQGRYLLVLLPVVGVAVVRSTAWWTRTIGHAALGRVARILLAVVGLAVVSQGGGVITYLDAIDESWVLNPDGRLSSAVVRAGECVDAWMLGPPHVDDPRR